MFCSPSCCLFLLPCCLVGASITPHVEFPSGIRIMSVWCFCFDGTFSEMIPSFENDASLLIYFIQTVRTHILIPCVCFCLLQPVFHQRPDGLQVWLQCGAAAAGWTPPTSWSPGLSWIVCLCGLIFTLLIGIVCLYIDSSSAIILIIGRKTWSSVLIWPFVHVVHPVAAVNGKFQLVFKHRVWREAGFWLWAGRRPLTPGLSCSHCPFLWNCSWKGCDELLLSHKIIPSRKESSHIFKHRPEPTWCSSISQYFWLP